MRQVALAAPLPIQSQVRATAVPDEGNEFVNAIRVEMAPSFPVNNKLRKSSGSATKYGVAQTSLPPTQQAQTLRHGKAQRADHFPDKTSRVRCGHASHSQSRCLG